MRDNHRRTIEALSRMADKAARVRALEAELTEARHDLASEIRASVHLPIQAVTVAEVTELSRSRVFQIRRSVDGDGDGGHPPAGRAAE